MEKLDLKKEKSHLFKMKDGEIKEVHCTLAHYLTLDGEGDPNTSERYQKGVEALYKIAYTLKFKFKKKEMDFVVMPLSTLWWTENGERCSQENKNEWKWTMMIEIPSFINEDELEEIKRDLKEENILINEVLYNTYNEEWAMQVLHVGPYNEEFENVRRMHEEIEKKGYKAIGKHHEIYLNDPRKVEPSKLKTIIRQPVLKEDNLLDFNEEVEKFFSKLGESKTMVLSTTNGHRVSSRNMSMIINNGKFYFQTDIKFEKFRDISNNKSVALCVDNIQIEGNISKVMKLYNEDAKAFKEKFKEMHSNSYEAYSRLIDNRVFEIVPTLIKLYCYEGKNVVRKYIDFERGIAYKVNYLSF
ncbi:MAG: GyrI-like domain-containing protein [Clostridium sp.]